MDTFNLDIVKTEPQLFKNNWQQDCLDSIFQDNFELFDNFKAENNVEHYFKGNGTKTEKCSQNSHGKRMLPYFKLNPTCPRCSKSFSRTKKDVAHDMIAHVLEYHQDHYPSGAIEIIRRKYV